jgi:hypothetical protein
MIRTRHTQPSDLALEHAVEGRVIYLLALIALVQFGYPITTYGTVTLIAYEILYASMILVGVIVGRDSRRHMVFLAATGFTFFAASMFYAFNPSATWAVFLTYVTLIPYLTMLVWILARYLSIARVVTKDVLYAATAIYLLLGAIFVPLYGTIETLAPGALRDSSAPEQAVQWQQVIYFSYTTLTTAGYGDILPVSWWARSLANIEMIAGVLYITIIMARLVALYTSEKQGESK